MVRYFLHLLPTSAELFYLELRQWRRRSLNGTVALSEKFFNAHNSLKQEYAPTGVMSGAIILSHFSLKNNQFSYREFGYAPTDKTRPFFHLWEIENVYRCKSLSESDTISLLGKNTVEFTKAKQPKNLRFQNEKFITSNNNLIFKIQCHSRNKQLWLRPKK